MSGPGGYPVGSLIILGLFLCLWVPHTLTQETTHKVVIEYDWIWVRYIMAPGSTCVIEWQRIACNIVILAIFLFVAQHCANVDAFKKRIALQKEQTESA